MKTTTDRLLNIYLKEKKQEMIVDMNSVLGFGISLSGMVRGHISVLYLESLLSFC